MRYLTVLVFIFFFNDTATTEIYTLSLHDALPIYDDHAREPHEPRGQRRSALAHATERNPGERAIDLRSEEHTSELQSLAYLVCRLLLEKKKKQLERTRSSHATWLPSSRRAHARKR